jgi:UrcA family protein
MTLYNPIRDSGIRFKAVLLVLSGALAAGAATAAPSDDAPTLVVHYNPATLATDSGAKALYHRLVLAADQVCPSEPASGHWVNPALAECREKAIAGAVEKIHSQRLAAIAMSNSRHG